MIETLPLRRVLIIKMWALGDILMATPMLNALRAAHPGISITWLVDSGHAELLASHPLIDEVIALDSGAWRRKMRKGNIFGWLKQSLELRGQMQARHFDAVINCQPDKWWSAILCAAPRRVALYPSPTVPSSKRYYTIAIPRPKVPSVHNTDHYLLATQALGCPDVGKEMTIGETVDERPFVEQFRRTHSLFAGKPLVVIAPFSTAENRSFEPDLTAKIADWLSMDRDANIVMTIGPKDIDKARAITQLMEQAKVVIAEGTTVRQYVALLRAADLVITGDSSPMHIAAAVGTPYVALFGPTPANERAPLAGEGIVLSKPLPCAPCDTAGCVNPVFRQCLKLITLTDVQSAVASLLPLAPLRERGPGGEGALAPLREREGALSPPSVPGGGRGVGSSEASHP